MGEAGNGEKQTDTRTPVAAAPAGWGFELPARWRLQRLLGQGGQAEVWLAMDERLGELVAVKIFHPAVSAAALGRLRREVRLGRSLQHSNLVRIYELIEADGRLALAMEWLPQGNLAAKLERDGPLATDEVVAVAQQVLVALEHLQTHGVVHRDIKPSNLLLDAQGRVKVGDLGLVKVAEDGEHLTQTATTVGSPGYMSPEQIRGQELTPASDLYSLGVTLFHLLTGQPPFQGTSNFEVAHAHIEQPAPDPRRLRSDCPRWLAWFIRRLLEKQPRDRWPDAATARRVLEKHRTVASPRFWRRLAAVSVLTVAAVATVFMAGRWLLGSQASPVAADVVAEGNHVRGLDSRGRTLWSFTCGAPVQEIERANLFGDGTTQVVACAYRKTDTYVRVEHEVPSEVVILGLDGRLVSEFTPDAAATSIDVTPIAPPVLVPVARAVDLLGNGQKEILVNCRHRVLGTAYLFVFWPRSGRWDLVLAELTFTPPDGRGRLAFSDASNQGIAGASTPRWSSFSWYTLIEQAAPGAFDTDPGFVMEPDGSSHFAVNRTRCTVDRWGNPSSGPNAGPDLRALRIGVVARSADLVATANSGDKNLVLRDERTLFEDAAPLLVERPYRAVVALYSARAHAQIVDLEGGIDLLRLGWQATANDSLGLNLGHLQAIAGDRLQVAEVEAQTVVCRRLPTQTQEVDAAFQVHDLGVCAGRIERDDGAVGPLDEERRGVLEQRALVAENEVLVSRVGGGHEVRRPGHDADPQRPEVPAGVGPGRWVAPAVHGAACPVHREERTSIRFHDEARVGVERSGRRLLDQRVPGEAAPAWRGRARDPLVARVGEGQPSPPVRRRERQLGDHRRGREQAVEREETNAGGPRVRHRFDVEQPAAGMREHQIPAAGPGPEHEQIRCPQDPVAAVDEDFLLPVAEQIDRSRDRHQDRGRDRGDVDRGRRRVGRELRHEPAVEAEDHHLARDFVLHPHVGVGLAVGARYDLCGPVAEEVGALDLLNGRAAGETPQRAPSRIQPPYVVPLRNHVRRDRRGLAPEQPSPRHEDSGDGTTQ